MLKITDLYDLTKTYPAAAEYLGSLTYAWEALPGIKALIEKIGASLSPDEYDHPAETVWIAKDAEVYPSAFLGDHVIIGHKSSVRHCAFVRTTALVGANCVVGNSTELKNVILFDNVQVPHYNYVGDSILGFHAHMGAGSITSNVKADRADIVIREREEKIQTPLHKIGAMLGDYAEIGCNAVLNPGVVIGRHSNVYPTSSVRGTVPENSIFKTGGVIVPKQ